jgi:cyclopropane fatty-acyl-phospholipid synthase-like methyltransferase
MKHPRRPARHPHLARALALLALGLALPLGGCTTAKRFMYEGFGRDAWQQPDRVVADLALAPGAKVADLGSGGGYFTFRLARAVGNSGRVYAVDVDAGMNEHVAEEAAEQGLANVTSVLAAADDPRLPERVDLVFTCNTYHHLSERVAYFTRVRERYLMPGARIAVVDFRPEVTNHSTPRETIEQELTAAGFRLEKSFDDLERQHFLVFTVVAENPEEPAR